MAITITSKKPQYFFFSTSDEVHMKGGFTLVELIVSMALFTVVIFIVTTAFLNLAQLHKSARATMVAINSVSVAIESMARNIRIGDTYRCGQFYGSVYPDPTTASKLTSQDCPGGNTEILFYTPDASYPGGSMLTGYRYRAPSETPPNAIQVRGGGTCCSYLTSPDNVKITNLTFYVTGTQSSSVEQPRVRIILQGETKTTPVSKFSIYTSVTQRSSK